MLMESFEVKNFRSLKHLRLDKLTRVNLLVGKNNSGKTSVLEGIYALSSVEMPSWLTVIDRNIGLEKFDVRYLFYNFDDSQQIVLIADYTKSAGEDEKANATLKATLQTREYALSNSSESGSKERRISRKSPTVAVFANLYTSPNSEAIPFEIELNPKATSEDDEVHAKPLSKTAEYVLAEGMDFPAYSRTIVNAISTKMGLRGLSQKLEEMKIQKEDGKILRTLKSVDPRVVSIDIVGGDIYLDLGQQFRMLVPLNLMGDGVQRLLMVVTFIAGISGGVILIDEIDNGLHYSALRILWKGILQAAREYDVQVFVTTHSAEALRHLTWVLDDEEYQDHRDDVAAYTLIRADDDTVRSYRYDYEQLEFALEHDMEVRN